MTFDYVPPNQTMLEILRLYLEKYAELAEEDKKLYRKGIEAMVHPPRLLHQSQGTKP